MLVSLFKRRPGQLLNDESQNLNLILTVTGDTKFDNYFTPSISISHFKILFSRLLILWLPAGLVVSAAASQLRGPGFNRLRC